MMRRMLLIPALVVALCSCEHIDDKRLPPAAVHIGFDNVGEWSVYGISGAGSYRYFIKSERVPEGYPYTALTYTGFGGVLLVGDIHGNPVAYDLACPVECKSTTRVQVLPDELKAECPVCHSVYDIVTNYGQPVSGIAAKRHYGLTRYYAGPGPAGEYMVISR